MRTIVALVFVLNLAGQVRPVRAPAPQRPDSTEPIEVLEKFVAQVPDDVPTRVALLQRYFTMPEGALPPELIRRERRRHILWMIEHRPGAPELNRPIAVIEPAGRFADPDGYAEASKAWYSRAAVPSATPQVIANAIFFFRFHDRAAARDLLEYGLKNYPLNHDLERMRGMLDAMVFLGAKEADQNGTLTSVDGMGGKSPAAVKIREEIEATNSAALAGGAGQFLAQQAGFLLREPVLGDEDPLALAEEWLNHAHRLDPENGAWIDGLLQVYQRDAGLALDPHAKVQYLSKAMEVADTQPRQMRILNDRMEAEFDAGDAAAAGHDAEQLLDIVTVNPAVGNFDQMIHAGETMLGRVALAEGRREEANKHLKESARVKLPSAPRMTLAQDLLDAGERDAVLEYLEACRAFWKYDEGRIDHFEKLIRAQAKPDILTPWRPAGLALIRRKAPAFELTDLAGREWKLEGRPVALLFWSVRCAECLDQMRELEKIAGYQVLAVNGSDDEAQVREYLSKNRIELPVAIEAKQVERQYEADDLPALAVIDQAGEVAAYVVGAVAPDALRAQMAKGGAAGLTLGAPVTLAPEACATFAWRPVPGAESYVVEWDARSEKGWASDREEGRLGVIPTRETSAKLDCEHGCQGRWRVYGVGTREGAGPVSGWREYNCR